jgi:hypothetical protein
MRVRSKAAIAIAVAVLLVIVSAAAAFAAAAQQQVALQVGSEMGSGYSGSYGDEIVLAPASMTSIELPGDKFHFQVLVNDVDASGTPLGRVWKDFQDFEDIQLEDTNTVQPFVYQIGKDDKVILTSGASILPKFPYQIRCEYKPNLAGYDASGTPKAGSSTAPPSYSETETVTLVRNSSTAVVIHTSGAVRHAGTTLGFQVAPDCGVGKVQVVIKLGSKTTLTKTLTTSEDGYVSAKLKLGNSTGKYRVSAKFLGNMFGAVSPWSSLNVKAAR